RALAKGDFTGWAARLSYAVRSADATIGDAALAVVALPKASRTPDAGVRSAERVEVESVADRVADEAVRGTVRSDRQQAMSEELARFGWLWFVAAVAIIWGLHQWSGQTWASAGLLGAALGGVSAVAVAARHLVAARPHATIGWAFCTAALAYAGQSFATSFHGNPVQVPTRAWWVLMAYGVVGAWVSRLF